MSGFTIRHRGAAALMARDFACPACGPFTDTVANPPPDLHPCPGCGWLAERVDSAPAVHTQFVVSVSRGKSDEKPHPMSMDLRNLGEGQKQGEWKAERRKLWLEQDRKRVKAALE